MSGSRHYVSVRILTHSLSIRQNYPNSYFARNAMNDTIKIWKSNLQGLLEEVVGPVYLFGASVTSNGQIPRLCCNFQERAGVALAGRPFLKFTRPARTIYR
jgi:hypothetical protein